MSEFFQEAPQLGNQYDDDSVLRGWLEWRLPADLHAAIEPGLCALGARVAGDVLDLANAAEAEPPRVVHYDAWGRRIDRIVMAPAWRSLHAVAAEEGIVATAYERREGAWSRVHQFARLYLFHPSSALYTCPLAMSDGAARVLELHGPAPLVKDVLPRLVSRDPARMWTSGQWMTERTGGSDVSGTSTEARIVDGRFRLYGQKWFTSAVTSEMALALARVQDSRGLSLFYLETRNADGTPNRMRIDRLKDKLGTRAMPTAELTLEGTPAELIGQRGEGVHTIATVLNITRLYNACCAVASMRRALALARDYARRRIAFGRPLIEQPLHAATLDMLDVELRAGLMLVFELAVLMGAEEAGEASAEERALLRLMTPVAKLYTAKQAVAVCSEALECFGGAGYIEDTGLPRLLRDAQVLPIWEGTTNVLSLDVLRVLDTADSDAFAAFVADVGTRVRAHRLPAPLAPARAGLLSALSRLSAHVTAMPADKRGYDVQAGARRLSYALARCFAAALLIEFASAGAERDDGSERIEAALRWCEQDLAPLREPSRTGAPGMTAGRG
jgi:alkylation response protein AidB-like acyl-CoA dehydrogenase